MVDALANFAVTAVASTPSNPSTATTIAVSDSTVFPAAPFTVCVWPAGAQPVAGNAELLRVTSVASGQLTVTRQAEGTAARSITAGDQVAQNVTAGLIRQLVTAPPLPEVANLYGWKYAPVDPLWGRPISRTPDANSRWGIHGYTPTAFTFSNVDIQVNSAGSSDYASTYLAAYDGAFNLVGSSVDVGAKYATLNSNMATFAMGSTVTVPAGHFFLVFRWGSGTTRPNLYCNPSDVTQTQNAGLSNSMSAPASFYRLFTIAGDWSGATPPASSAWGYVDKNFSCPIFGLR